MQNLKQKSLTASRILLGLIFTVFGLNGFLQFLPMPPLEGTAAQFMGALAASGYFFPLLKGTEVIAGLALLSNRFVPLALLALAPIALNIVAFHLVLAPGAYGMLVLIVGTGLHVAWGHRQVFAPLLRGRSVPAHTGQQVQSLSQPVAEAI